MPRKKNTDGKVQKPLLRFERIIYERVSFRLRQGVLRQIAEYVLYVKEVAGEEPTLDELVDRGMQRLFDADRGFRQWLQEREGQGRNGVRTETVQEPKSDTGTFPVSVPVRNSFSD